MNGEKLSSEPYKGVRDFYPADWARLQGAFAVVRRVLTARGYEEYNASPMERSELYESKGNEEIVNEQTYTFEDRGGRMVTLRPEMTPSLARLVAAKRRELPFPLRWFSIGNRFRYERPQKGRLREFYQCDIDLVGLPAGAADAEIVAVASEILRAFGAQDAEFVIRVSSRALLTAACEAAGLSGEAMRRYTRLLDKKAKMPTAEFDAAVAALANEDPLKLIAENDPRVAPARAEVDALLEQLRARGVANARFDPTLARGFDYYTGMVFEIFDTNPENPRALFGGGRYDGLVSLFGGDPVPAVGFALGDVTLLDFLETHGHPIAVHTQADAYIGTPSPEDLPGAEAFAARLRAAGARAFVNLTSKSLGDQIRDASRRGIPYFIAYGSGEAQSGRVKLKELATGTETELPAEEAGAFLAEKRA
jgi:histidyl-tRNA synthetase